MAEDCHDRIDGSAGVDIWIRPRCYDLLDCMTDDDDGDLSGRFVEETTEMIYLSGTTEGRDTFGKHGVSGVRGIGVIEDFILCLV